MSNRDPAKPTHRPHIKTRILLLSDTHSALPDPLNKPNLPFSRPFPPTDIAIHSGDLTSTGKPAEHRRALQLLKSLPAPLKIVIPGNHDLTLDRKYCNEHPILYAWKRPHNEEDLQDAYHLYTNRDATDVGIIYVVEGTHSFALPNGAKLTVYVSAYTPEFCDWGFAYPRDIDLFNASQDQMPDHPVPEYGPDNVDDKREGNQCLVMITHGPPKGILDRTTRGENVGCDHLMKAVGRCRPLLHTFGHIHEGWGSERKKWPSRHDDWNTGSHEQDEEFSQKEGLTGKELEEYKDWQEKRKKQVVTEEARVVENTIQRADEETMSENKANDPVALTEQQRESVSYIDASTVKHGLETLFVNASIMDVRYNPCQKPWIVDLMLPAATEEEQANPRLSIYVARDSGVKIDEEVCKEDSDNKAEDEEH